MGRGCSDILTLGDAMINGKNGMSESRVVPEIKNNVFGNVAEP